MLLNQYTYDDDIRVYVSIDIRQCDIWGDNVQKCCPMHANFWGSDN